MLSRYFQLYFLDNGKFDWRSHWHAEEGGHSQMKGKHAEKRSFHPQSFDKSCCCVSADRSLPVHLVYVYV